MQFQFAPSFDFKTIPGAKTYRFSIQPAKGETLVFTADKPTASLAPIWVKLSTGKVTLTVGGHMNPANYMTNCSMEGGGYFLDVHAATKDEKYLAAVRDKAIAWMMQNPVRTWNWQGQFEDVKALPPYENLTKHEAGDEGAGDS